MKKIIYIIIMCVSFFACEDVVQLDLKTTEPRLVIDASINWIKETAGNNQFIKLTLTAPFYNTTIPPATGATVTIRDEKGHTFNFMEEKNTGIYINQSFIPAINGVYTLKIMYRNEIYTGTETLQPVVKIDRVEQKNNGGFTKNETEIKAFYTDPKNVKNYYLFEFESIDLNTLSLDVYDDEFNDGNEIFAYYSNKDIKPENELIIHGYGVSRRFYDYMFILLQQSNDDTGSPFETQPASVRGNCMNETNPDNYPLGYFRVSEAVTYKYVVK